MTKQRPLCAVLFCVVSLSLFGCPSDPGTTNNDQKDMTSNNESKDMVGDVSKDTSQDASDMKSTQDATQDTSQDTPQDASDMQDTSTEMDESKDTSQNTPEDITDKIFSNRSPDCSNYVGSYIATAKDLSANNRTLTSMLEITDGNDQCTFVTNSVPNHDFGRDMSSFASPVMSITKTFVIPQNPQPAAMPTQLTLRFDNAIFLNGTKLDLLAAACYGIGNAPLGQERIGCNQANTPWRYDPMFANSGFRTDSHNAHTQSNGAYHYHGDPVALYDLTGKTESGVIGFAADGFPIFGPYIDDNGTIRRVKSGYKLKSGMRVSQMREGAFPAGTPDGTYIDDYEWSAGHGDLDACNGMTRNGTYGYYVTDSYPWVMGCFTGTPDASFRKSMMMGNP